jgi:NAD(P)-dependent dehydrogenase (short-subunit alcohol dehydrogenase family)
MWESIDRYFEEANPGGDPQAWRKLIRVPPLGRQLRLDDISELVVFLASSGSDFITGQTINIEGGLTMN